MALWTPSTITAVRLYAFRCIASRSKLRTNLLGLFQFILWLDRNKMGTSFKLVDPTGQTERALCHIYCRQTPNSLKLCMFLFAARHCLQRMERLQYIMRGCGCFVSLLVFFSYVCLLAFSFLHPSLLRYFILSWFHSVFFVLYFSLCFCRLCLFFLWLSYVSLLIGGLELLCLELDGVKRCRRSHNYSRLF